MGNMQLMIVDDEERFLNTTKSLLEKKGVPTFIAANGADAMNILDKERIDVVILDVKMPGLDGIEALRIMKKRHPLVEVIMLTGHASAEAAIEGLSLGAFDYLMKPCDVPTLLKKANEAYDRKKAAETDDTER
jgi:DNA-binding NtrC family response regulator